MNEELMRRISSALDSEDGITGDAELARLLTESPEAAVYARHLARMNRWLASWPLEAPDEAALEVLAARIEGRLGQAFSGDFTRAPDFDDDDSFGDATSGLLQAGDLVSDPSIELAPEVSSDAIELGASSILDISAVAEESSTVSIGRVPLRKTVKGAVTELHASKRKDPRSGEDDLPTVQAPAQAPGAHAPVAVPHPRAFPPRAKAGAAASGAPAASAAPAASGAPAASAAPAASGASAQGAESSKPEAPKAAPLVPKAEPELREAKRPQPPARAAAPLDGRVSIPMPSATGPRLELLEGGAAPQPGTARAEKPASRGWLPGLLAAAAIGVGVIGAATLFSSGGREAAPRPTATAAVAPSTAGSRAAVAPSEGAPMAAEEAEASGAAPPQAPMPAMAEAPSAAPAPRFDPPGVYPPRSPAADLAPMGQGMGLDDESGRARRVSAPRAAAARVGSSTPVASPRSEATEGALARGAGAQPTTSAAEAPAPAPAAPTPPQRPSPASGGAPSGGGGAASASAGPSARPSGPVGETLDRTTVQSVMQGVEPSIRACAGERHGTVQIDLVVQGTGRVSSATVSGIFQGSPEGSCMARAVRGARFPAFTGEPLRFRYPFGL